MPRFVLVVLVCLAGAIGAPAAAAPARIGASWVDALHAWALSSDGLACTPRADLCATNDGGATWRGIFNGPIDQFVPTSARGGVVSLADGRVFWTRDGARHWYRTNRIFGRIAGSSGSLFATSDADLYRVAPWPPRGRARCRAWRVAAGDASSARGLRTTVCTGAGVEAGMTDRLVATVAGEAIGKMIAVPGGVFGLSDFAPDFSRLNAFVWRHGRLVQSSLPFPQPGWWCCAAVDASWPSLYVSGTLYVPPGSAGTPLPLLWRSPDGGATWSAYASG
jgi:hypothetical protein